MNVLLESAGNSFDLGHEDCDPRSYADHNDYGQHDNELLEPTFAMQQQQQQQQQSSSEGKRTSTRRTSTNSKKQQQQQQQQKPQSVPSKRKGSSKKAVSCTSSAASCSAVEGYTKRDILSGRGGLANKHFGNKVFRRLIKHNKDLYRRLKSKVKQELLIKSILLAVESQGGRFLREDKATGAWYQIDEKEAWSKTCQALREPDRGGNNKASDGSQDGSDDGATANDGGSVMSSSSTICEPAAARRLPAVVPREQQEGGQSFAPSVTALSPLTRITRQYTSDDPPIADRRIFDQAMVDGGALQATYDEEDAEAAAIAPTLLEMQTSVYSLSGFPPTPGGVVFGGSDRARRSFTYQQQQQQQNESAGATAESLQGFQGFGASYYQDYYGSNPALLHGGFGGGIAPPPPPQHQFLRHDSTGQLAHPLGHGRQPSQHPMMHASSPQFPLAPPLPLPLLRSASSAAFYRGLEEVTALDRQESAASFDFALFANGGGGGSNTAPV